MAGLRWRRAGTHRSTTVGALLAGVKPVLAYPGEYLDSLADRLSTLNVAHLPVVARQGRRLVGDVGWKDLMRMRAQSQAAEQQRTAFFALGRRGGEVVAARK